LTIHDFTFDADRHEYRENGEVRRSLTQILADVGIIDYSGIPQTVLQRKASLGSYVHKCAELLFQDDLDESTVMHDARGYLDALRAFLRVTKFTPDPAHIEQPRIGEVYGHRYGFTCDVTGTIGKHPYILELKCCARKEPWWSIQLAGQSAGLGMHREFRRWNLVALQLKPDGKYSCHPYTERTNSRIFGAAVLAVHEPHTTRGLAAQIAIQQWKGAMGRAAHA
jgi:hypothetical protein